MNEPVVIFTAPPQHGMVSPEVTSFVDPLLSANKPISHWYRQGVRGLWRIHQFAFERDFHKPSTLVFFGWGTGERWRWPSCEFLYQLQRKGWRLVVVWCDSRSDVMWRQRIQPVLHLFDTHIVVDNPDLKYIEQPERFRFHPVIFREDHLRDVHRYRPHELAFSGRPYQQRQLYLDALARDGFYVTGCTVSATRPPFDHYMTDLHLAKIGLNFTGGEILNARVFEVMRGGAMLLDYAGGLTRQLFIPGGDYVSFDSYPDLRDHVRYYLSHPDERISIAASGQAQAQRWTIESFWNLIISH